MHEHTGKYLGPEFSLNQLRGTNCQRRTARRIMRAATTEADQEERRRERVWDRRAKTRSGTTRPLTATLHRCLLSRSVQVRKAYNRHAELIEHYHHRVLIQLDPAP